MVTKQNEPKLDTETGSFILPLKNYSGHLEPT